MPQARQLISASQAKTPLFVGLDLGGTAVKAGLVDDLGRTLSWLSIPTEPEKGPEDAAKRMGQAALEAIRQAGLEPSAVARVGLGAPGSIDPVTGKLNTPANLKGWEGFPLRNRVSEHCSLPVTSVNDANAAAYGEFWVGSGRDFHSMVLFTLGTGIGCGIIVGDLTIDGEHYFGAECGHIIIDHRENARMCGCGLRGHLEAYASATGVIKRTRELLDAGRSSSLAKRLAEGADLTPKLVAEEADTGDALSLEIVAETARLLAVGIVSLMHTIDPTGVLLAGAMTFGGGGTPLGRQFLDWIREEVKRRTYRVLAEKTVIDFATLGNDAGYIGAAGMARLEYRKLARAV